MSISPFSHWIKVHNDKANGWNQIRLFSAQNSRKNLRVKCLDFSPKQLWNTCIIFNLLGRNSFASKS